MPPKNPFSAERAQEFGKLAVVKTTESFGKDGLPAAAVLDCAYRGIATHDGGVDNAVPITAESTLVYDWRFTCEGFEETREMKVQCRDASKQGVPFPDTWRTALKCLQMSTLVGSALEAARQESDAADVDCKFLGAARMTNPADPGETRPGAIVMLDSNGTTMAYILCSWVRGSNWLCHRGTFDDRGKLDDKNPFDERSLVLPHFLHVLILGTLVMIRKTNSNTSGPDGHRPGRKGGRTEEENQAASPRASFAQCCAETWC